MVLLDVPGGHLLARAGAGSSPRRSSPGAGVPRRPGLLHHHRRRGGGHRRAARLLPQLPLVPLGRRPAGPAHGHPPGHGPAGRPQPPVRRHRDVAGSSARSTRCRPNGPTTTWWTCPGWPSASTRSTTAACASSSTPSTDSSTAEHGPAPVAVAPVGTGGPPRTTVRGGRALPGRVRTTTRGWVLGLDPVVTHQRRRVALGEPAGLVDGRRGRCTSSVLLWGSCSMPAVYPTFT